MIQVISHRARKAYEPSYSASIVCDHVSLHGSMRSAVKAAKAWFAEHPESFVALYEGALWMSPIGHVEVFGNASLGLPK